jgi:hypothetical protein
LALNSQGTAARLRQQLELVLSVAGKSTQNQTQLIKMDRIEHACKFLVAVMDDGQTADFIHISVREYLKRSYGQWWDTEHVHDKLEEALFRASQASEMFRITSRSVETERF